MALLALWELYERQESRRVIIAAALLVQSPRVLQTLQILGEDVEPHLKKARESPDPAIRRAANDALVEIAPRAMIEVLIERAENQVLTVTEALQLFAAAANEPEAQRLLSAAM